MRIDVFANYREAIERKLRDHVVVVLDILRAGTSILEAIEMGADCVVPVATIEEAVALRRARGGGTILAGEREGKPIEGFDLGNSPLEFTNDRVRDKTIVMATTNGTKAIKHVEQCDPILIGSLRNRRVLCDLLKRTERPIALLCAGTDGDFSADDIYGAGALIYGLRQRNVECEIADLGLLAEQFYLTARDNRDLLEQASHYRYLKTLGFHDDLEFCFEEDVSEVIPCYASHQITRLQ